MIASRAYIKLGSVAKILNLTTGIQRKRRKQITDGASLVV